MGHAHLTLVGCRLGEQVVEAAVVLALLEWVAQAADSHSVLAYHALALNVLVQQWILSHDHP